MEFFLGSFSTDWEQRKAAYLHDLSLGSANSRDEEERRRTGGAVPAARLLTGGGKPSLAGVRVKYGLKVRRANRSMRSRFAGLATGGQPAVVKMASFGDGGRLGAMISYVSRGGAIAVENERGEQLQGRDHMAVVADEWDHLMSRRAESRDVGTFSITVERASGDGDDLAEEARGIVRHALGDRLHSFAISPRSDRSGFDIEGVTVLRDRHGERLTADGKATEIVQRRIDGSATFQFTDYGNGTDYGTARLRSLVARHDGDVRDEKGRVIVDAKMAGDLVQLEWREALHSRKPRDVMHVILSARAGTNAEAFHNAARDFLASQFASHRYVFSLHDPANDPKDEARGGKRPHVHVHAIVAMRSDAGDRIETTIAAFRHWRLAMAQKARAHGISMEMTDRRDRSSPAHYTKNQVRQMNTIGHTQHHGTSPAAQRRYEAKRRDEPSEPTTARGRAYQAAARSIWQEEADYCASGDSRAFSMTQLTRISEGRAQTVTTRVAALAEVESGSQFRTYVVKMADLVFQGASMRRMTRTEFEAYEKRVETALFQAERTVTSDEKGGLMEIAKIAREHVAARRELMEFTEEQMSKLRAPRESSSRTADREDEHRRWSDAVERHGLDAAAAANKALVDIERVRGDIEKLQGREQIDDGARTLKEELRLQLSKAAELGASGNTLIHDAAEIDVELKTAILNAERERRLADRDKREWSEATGAAAGPGRDAANDKVIQDPATVGRASSSQEGSARADAERSGDTTKDDPAKQHVPRLEELQRQADHDRDDRER
ncbi:conjugal transfer protein TraA [Rhizobium laguerreae]|uniref:conjugal transfer protein TraA n=1 Tax=Rhizobium laguerreae TaxID=1076926 RepID=UPI001C921180|nr:conjugal transfer protein TraA [Rhizobium laguerreae]MBY3101289.1 conjugal transfer protein TraA [Rhizobium laguerreae]